MKIPFLCIIIILSAMKVYGQIDSFDLPKEWDKNFVISISHTGSMSGGSSHITFTHDSCKYVTTSPVERPAQKFFVLSQKDRDTILAKMRALKIDRVKAGMKLVAQNDGWSNMLCLGWHCIEGGSASDMSTEDKNTFLEASSFLELFAIER
jgi:hypothetical protein